MHQSPDIPILPRPRPEAGDEGDIPTPEEQTELLRQEILCLRPSDCGPTARDVALFEELYVRNRSEYVVAAYYAISPRTVRNVARATQRLLALRELRWGRMTLLELVQEEERLDRLWRGAMGAWSASQRPLVSEREVRCGDQAHPTTWLTITVRPRTGDVRFLEIAQRLIAQLCAIEMRIEVCVRALVTGLRPGTHSTEALPPEGAGRAAEPRAVRPRPEAGDEVAAHSATARAARLAARTVPARTRRRKALGGKRLRLPRLVRTARRARPGACLLIAIQSLQRSLARCRGDPAREVASVGATHADPPRPPSSSRRDKPDGRVEHESLMPPGRLMRAGSLLLGDRLY